MLLTPILHLSFYTPNPILGCGPIGLCAGLVAKCLGASKVYVGEGGGEQGGEQFAREPQLGYG